MRSLTLKHHQIVSDYQARQTRAVGLLLNRGPLQLHAARKKRGLPSVCTVGSPHRFWRRYR